MDSVHTQSTGTNSETEATAVACCRCGSPQPCNYCPSCGESRPVGTADCRCGAVIDRYCPSCGERLLVAAGHRRGVEHAGDDALLLAGATGDAHGELRRVLDECDETALASLEDPDLADQ